MSTLTPAQNALLLERARRLAVRPVEVGTQDMLELLTFRLGAEWGALELSTLAGILLPDISVLPDVSPLVLGIQSVRGAVVCVLDLCALLELAPLAANPLEPDRNSSESQVRVLLLETPHGTVGFRVDEVGETRTAPVSALIPPVSARGGVRGILEGRILLLEVAGLLERVR